MKRNLIALFVVLLVCGAASAASTTYLDVPGDTPPSGDTAAPFNVPAPSAVTFYDDEAAFLADAGAVVNEPFVNTTAEPGGVCGGTLNILNSETSDACVSPGDMIEGFSLIADAASAGYVVVGTGFLGAPAPMAGPNTFTSGMDIDFDPPTNSIGFDLYGLLGAVDVDITLFDSGGALIDTVNVPSDLAGQFVGMVSDDAIAKLTFVAPADQGELIGNLYFGGSGTGDGGGGAVPATNTWGVILLIALFMGISIFYLRRRANA